MESSYSPRVSPDEPLEIFLWCFYGSESCLNPDIFVPEFWLRCDKVLHHVNAGRVLCYFDGDASGFKKCFFTHEGAVLTDDHFRDAVEQDSAGTHSARR